MSCVVLGMPTRPGQLVHLGGALAFLHSPTRDPELEVHRAFATSSVLPHCFNTLWVGALNSRAEYGATRFAMLHDDVCPDPGWLDTLLAELDRTGADVVGAVVPIRDARGLTSTAVDDQDGAWHVRRLTMSEVYGLPPTFGSEHVKGPLLLNTGLWVCRLDRPWCAQVCFRDDYRIVPADGGVLEAQAIPEDWDFSRQVRKAGGTLLATRKVGLHHGEPGFHNRGVWGGWTRDEEVKAAA